MRISAKEEGEDVHSEEEEEKAVARADRRCNRDYFHKRRKLDPNSATIGKKEIQANCNASIRIH